MEPKDWLMQNAPECGKLEDDELKAITYFCLLWSLFEARVLEKFADIEKITGAVIAMKQRGRISEGCCKDAFEYFQDRYTNGDSFNEKFEALNFREGDKRGFVEDVLMNRVSDPDPALILEALLIIIYRLRNNLFHGEKWDYGIKCQKENFRQANNVLMRVMDLHQN